MVERVVPRWNRYPEQPKRVVPFEAHNTFNPESAQWAHNLSAQPCAQSPRTTVPCCGAQARTNPSAQPQRTPFAHNPRAQPPTLVRTMKFFSVKYSMIFPQLRRGDFRYTTILFNAFPYVSVFATPARQFLVHNDTSQSIFSCFCFRNSGNTILGMPRYLRSLKKGL